MAFSPQVQGWLDSVNDWRVAEVHPVTGEPIMVNPYTNEKMAKSLWDQKNAQIMIQRDSERTQFGLNQDGSPIRPEWESMIDPDTGLLKTPYQYKPDVLDPESLAGFQQLKKRVTTVGPSDWANLMLQKQAEEQAQAKDQAARQQMSSQAQAQAQLASKGGLTSGAAERLAMSGARGLMGARQDVARQEIGNRLGILTEDEKQRMSLLPGFAQGEAGLMGSIADTKNTAQKYNIESALRDIDAKRQADLNTYSEQMKKWAAEREAQATEKSSQGGK